MSEEQVSIEVLDGIKHISASEWDACADPISDDPRSIDPFTTHRFLLALEESGSVGQGTGWVPRHLVARIGNETIACAPFYAKSHSQGEYIFDHNFAHAYESAGGQYYPKFQMAVPFTPATGRRFLTKPGRTEVGISALVQGAVQLTAENHFSSFHVTFCTEEEALAGQKIGLMHRTSQQFHWENPGYVNWDEFVNALSSRKRKNIRKEREQANDFGGSIIELTGEQIEAHHWDAFWRFYQDTGNRKWGTPYLTREFFEQAHGALRDDMLLVLAIRDGVAIAGALNFIGSKTLFGRYWGCIEDHPCLHFELCYYRAIDYAIKHGLRVEAGAQGGHKLARGYMPVTTHSLHWFADKGFAEAVEKYLIAERNAIDEDIEIMTSYGPFKRSGDGEQ